MRDDRLELIRVIRLLRCERMNDIEHRGRRWNVSLINSMCHLCQIFLVDNNSLGIRQIVLVDVRIGCRCLEIARATYFLTRREGDFGDLRFRPMHSKAAVRAASVDSRHRCHVAVALLALLLTKRDDESV